MENAVEQQQVLEVLSDEELALVVGGGGSVDGVRAYVYNKLGICACGVAH